MAHYILYALAIKMSLQKVGQVENLGGSWVIKGGVKSLNDRLVIIRSILVPSTFFHFYILFTSISGKIMQTLLPQKNVLFIDIFLI